MHRAEFMPLRRKQRRPILSIGLAAILLLCGIVGYFYGSDLYYLFSGDTLQRARTSSHKLGLQIFEADAKPRALLDQIEDSRRLLSILEARDPALAEILYEQALLDFWEILVRMPVDADNLLQLIGRGYLPLQRGGSLEKLPSMVRPALELSKRVRRAIALDPELAQKPDVHILLLYGDFIYSGRTDPHLLERLKFIEKMEIPDHLRIPYQWIALSLNALLGQPDALARQIKAIAVPQASGSAGSDQGVSANLPLRSSERDLVMCHGYFIGKRYHRARLLARKLKSNPELGDTLRAEAARMEAEITLRQMGPAASVYKFQEAFVLSKESDPFIKQRLETVRGK